MGKWSMDRHIINYINDFGYEVPKNTILSIPFEIGSNAGTDKILSSLSGEIKRDWFKPFFYYCLPLNIGNQYGFLVKSLADFDAIWDGTDSPAEITFLENYNHEEQIIDSNFGSGVITFQNKFLLKTPPGINIMTIQPPNIFIPGCSIMTGVVETDQIRRDFTFNLKITVPNYKVSIRKGDAIGAFIPIPRYFVDQFEIKDIGDVFSKELHESELLDMKELWRQRDQDDLDKHNESGRKYFNGQHAFGDQYVDHQKHIS